MSGSDSPWTDDSIIQKYNFTNAYRASDRVSQYLIRHVIYENEYYTPEDQCFRILFFKLFNKIETWNYVKDALGEITYSSYNYDRYNDLLLKKIESKDKIYSAAYIMPSGKSCFGFDKKHSEKDADGGGEKGGKHGGNYDIVRGGAVHRDADGDNRSGDELQGSGVQDEKHRGRIFRVFRFVKKVCGFDAVGGCRARNS